MRYGNKTVQFGHTIQLLNLYSGTYKLWAEMVWAEMVMDRNGHGPKWLWAEMTSDQQIAQRGSGIFHGLLSTADYDAAAVNVATNANCLLTYR